MYQYEQKSEIKVPHFEIGKTIQDWFYITRAPKSVRFKESQNGEVIIEFTSIEDGVTF